MPKLNLLCSKSFFYEVSVNNFFLSVYAFKTDLDCHLNLCIYVYVEIFYILRVLEFKTPLVQGLWNVFRCGHVWLIAHSLFRLWDSENPPRGQDPRSRTRLCLFDFWFISPRANQEERVRPFFQWKYEKL